MRSAFSILRRPYVARLLLTSFVGRLPMTTAGLLLIVRTRDLGLGYGTAGAVAGLYGAALAISAPPLGRLIDRRGQTTVLLACGLGAASVYAMLALLPHGAPAAAVAGLAVAAGIANPPLSAAVRALWDDLLPGPDERHRILSLESALLEAVFVLGPLVFVTGLASWSIPLALATAGAFLLAGAWLFAANPASRARRPHAGATRTRAGALAARPVRVLVALVAVLGVSFGAIEIACAAFAEDAGHRGAVGLLLGTWGVGSGLGGLWAAHAGAPADREAHLRRLIGVLALLDLTPALTSVAGLLPATTVGLAILATTLLAAGVAIAPTLSLAYGLIGDVAPAGTQTEAYTWLNAAIMTGIASGSAIGGATIGDGPATGALLVAAAAGCAAALTAAATMHAGARAATATAR